MHRESAAEDSFPRAQKAFLLGVRHPDLPLVRARLCAGDALAALSTLIVRKLVAQAPPDAAIRFGSEPQATRRELGEREMAAVSADRLAAIKYWWDWVCCGFSHPPRLREAFVDVLGRLSDEAWARFLDYFPLVLSLDGRLGGAFRPIPLPEWAAHRARPTILGFSPDSIEQTPGGLLALVAHEVGHVVLGHCADGTKLPYQQREAEVAEFIARLGIQEPDEVELLDNYWRLRSVERTLRSVSFLLADVAIEEPRETRESVRAAAKSRVEMALAELRMVLSCLRALCTGSPPGIVRTTVLPDDQDRVDSTRPIRTAVRE